MLSSITCRHQYYVCLNVVGADKFSVHLLTYRSISKAADFRFSLSRSLNPFDTGNGSSSLVAIDLYLPTRDLNPRSTFFILRRTQNNFN